MGYSFGIFLKQKRQEKKLTQKDLAKLLYVSESAISKWEKNIAHPDVTLLPKLSEILGVTEHEIITASIDNKTREEKAQAKKWRVFSISWSLFFYIAYSIALITCFICNLAIDRSLSWFWIVLSALLFSFTFTNLPKLLKKHKLFLLPLLMYLSLCLLFAVCCTYTQGDWFLIVSLSVLFVLVIIFMPIYISKYQIFSKIKKYNDFISIAIDFIVLNVLLIVIDSYCVAGNYAPNHWYFNIAIPIVIVVYLILNLFLSVRFLKINKLLKTSIILFFINILYLVIPFINVNNQYVQEELSSLNVLKSDLKNWQIETLIERNIHCIIFLTIAFLALCFLIGGFVLRLTRHYKNKNI